MQGGDSKGSRRAIRIGVTGKIGSGKSTLLRFMEQRGMAVINSDELARALMQENASLREKVIQLLGDEAYRDGKADDPSSALDRAFVASKIFQDSTLRKNLEAVVHPAVMREIEAVFSQSTPGKPVAVESALILQSNFRTHFDYIILIDSPDEVVLDRLLASGRMMEEDARSRLSEQHWADIPVDEADFTIENSDTHAKFEERCKAVLSLLDLLATRPLPEEPLHSEE
jgi:dephospho-CoA kinase